MKIKKIFLICIVAIALSGCSSQKSKLDEAEMIYSDVLSDYLEAKRIIYDGTVEIGDELTDISGSTYFIVEEEAYNNVSDINVLLKQVFTDGYIEHELAWVTGGAAPLYKDIDGKLCIAMKDATWGSIANEIKEIIRLDENILEFIGQNEDEKFKISLHNDGGNWLIDNIEPIVE